MNNSGDVLDWHVIENLRALGEGDDSFLVDLITTFLQETPALFERLQTAVASGDAGAIRLNAHSLKGSSAEFGASYLTELCRQLEMAGKQGDLEMAPDLLTEATDEYRRVEAALSRLIRAQG